MSNIKLSSFALFILVVAYGICWTWGKDTDQPAQKFGVPEISATSPRLDNTHGKSPSAVTNVNSYASGVEEKISRQKVSSALNSIVAPPRPTWEIVKDYGQDPNNPEKADQALAALSFCQNTKRNAGKAHEMQSQGLTSAPEYSAMKKIGEEHTQFCGRLLDSEFALRETIIKSRASAGDVDAMLSYLSVSPLGEWPTPDQFSDPKVQAWKAAGVHYLEQAVQMKNPGALLQLAILYEPGDKVAKDEPLLFGDMYDPIKGYSYAYTWSRVVAEKGTENAKSNAAEVLKGFEVGLSKAQIEKAKNNSQAVYAIFSKE